MVGVDRILMINSVILWVTVMGALWSVLYSLGVTQGFAIPFRGIFTVHVCVEMLKNEIGGVEETQEYHCCHLPYPNWFQPLPGVHNCVSSPLSCHSPVIWTKKSTHKNPQPNPALSFCQNKSACVYTWPHEGLTSAVELGMCMDADGLWGEWEAGSVH